MKKILVASFAFVIAIHSFVEAHEGMWPPHVCETTELYRYEGQRTSVKS